MYERGDACVMVYGYSVQERPKDDQHPRHWETDVFEWVKTYKEIMKQTDIISQHCLERFMISSKEGGAKDS